MTAPTTSMTHAGQTVISVANDQPVDYIEPMYIKEIDDPDGWTRPDSDYIPHWYATIEHRGRSPYHPTDPDAYPIFRNVKDYGAKGDGQTLDDDAIQRAMRHGGRCGYGCPSSTTQNAVVYFPPGTYLLSRPIQSYYGTSITGDPSWRPVLKAAKEFSGSALIDEDPYDENGKLWWINQDNFFRQTRNIVFDLRQQDDGRTGTGMHRPTSQATALSNCHFEMSTRPDTQQQGVVMEAGSGGSMSHLSFRGGRFGLSIGNQQFTVTNLQFEGQSEAAINIYWSWILLFQSISVRNTPTAILAPTDPHSTIDEKQSGQKAASVLLVDWRCQDVGVVLRLGAPRSGVFGLENVRAMRAGAIVVSDAWDADGKGNVTKKEGQAQEVTLPTTDAQGFTHVRAWMQGPVVERDRAARWIEAEIEPVERPSVLVDERFDDGRWFTCARPEYGEVSLEDVIDVKTLGAAGDGKTDDTAALQRALDLAHSRSSSSLVFIPHGVYVVTSTVLIHAGTRMVGEAYSILIGTGDFFNDMDNPQVVFRVGKRRRCSWCSKCSGSRTDGQGGGCVSDPEDEDEKDEEDKDFVHVSDHLDSKPNANTCLKHTNETDEAEDEFESAGVEISDIIFSTRGPAAGAIVVEWNVRGAHEWLVDPDAQGSAGGMWDAHVRLGGFRGSGLEGDTCPPEGAGSRTGTDMAQARAAFLGLHITPHASAYLSAVWVWAADHDLDRHKPGSKGQIAVYSGRGVLVENTRGGPVWMYGVGSEHHLLVQFNLFRARNVYLTVPQTESAYFQGTSWPSATQSQPPQDAYYDPRFDVPVAPTLGGNLDDPAHNRGLGILIRQSRDVLIFGAGLYSFFNNYNTSCNAKNGACQRSVLALKRIKPRANVVLLGLSTVGTGSMLDLDDARVVSASFWRNGFTATLGKWSA